MEILLSTLESMASGYRTETIRRLFIMNNRRHVVQILRECDFHLLYPPMHVTILEQHLRMAKEAYISESWSKAEHFLKEEENQYEIFRNGDLTKSGRQHLKQRCSGFNHAFEEQVHTQRQFSIPDRQLRDEVKETAIRIIVPQYKAMVDKYGNVPFSTKVDTKYLKHSPEIIEKRLRSLYDDDKT